MKVKRIVVRVQLELINPEYLASQSCEIDCSKSNRIDVSDVTDACQRAVAHCIDELEIYLDKP